MGIKVYVLQSLRNTDPKLGEQIRDFLDGQGISREFYDIGSPEELESALQEVANDIVTQHSVPYIHFHCHANNEGIGIAHRDGNETLLTWPELREYFRAIYMNSKKKSVLCMCCCEGFNVARLVAHNKPCPFDHVCGSFEEIGYSDSVNVFSELYKLVNEGKNPYEASVNVSNRPEYSHVKFLGVNAYTLFQIAVDGYIEQECTLAKLSAKKTEIINQVVAKFGFVDAIQLGEIDYLFTLEGQKKILGEHASTFFS